MLDARLSAATPQHLVLSDEVLLERVADAGRREAWAFAVVLSVRMGERALALGKPMGEVTWPGSLRRVAEDAGLDLPAATRAVAALTDAGLLRRGKALAFAPEALIRRVGSRLDWSAMLSRIAGQTAAILVARAHGQMCGASPDWTPIAAKEVAAITGYTVQTVRRARLALESAGVLQRQPERGGADLFRFSDQAWGATRQVEEPAQSLGMAPPALVEPAAPVTPAPHGERGILVELDGARVGIPHGDTFDPPPGWRFLGVSVADDNRVVMRYVRG